MSIFTGIARSLMPQNPVGDALLLGTRFEYHKCEYLLTWNCKQLRRTQISFSVFALLIRR